MTVCNRGGTGAHRVVRRAILSIAVLAALTSVGLFYADRFELPPGITAVVLPAFLLEAALYLTSCTASVREWLQKRRPIETALLLIATSILSYLVYTIPLRLFELFQFLALLGLSATASLWYVVLGRRTLADAAYLVLMAMPVLLKTFPPLFPDPVPRIPMHMLGLLMWYRTGIISVLVLRRMEGIGFGLWPRGRDWRIGMLHGLAFLPVGYLMALALGLIRPEPAVLTIKTAVVAIATFAGVLWVLAVVEECFFRGLLQQMLSRAMRSDAAGLLVTSILFGLAHIGFGNRFPNWPMVLVAVVAGLFYGNAFRMARSIRAAMVTHALVVTVWRVFLAG
jgi:uncharacterized protein